jgi:2-dehydropantoate 2-reductase
MQRDAEVGRPLELNAIAGAPLRATERHGIPCAAYDAAGKLVLPGHAAGRPRVHDGGPYSKAG